ncbi:MAG: hypothetical protein ACYTG0_45695, partial [Planctomycetota bacterium]
MRIEGSQMNERVVCIPLALVGDIPGHPYEELGRSGDVLWSSISDDPFIAIKEEHPQASLIYLSKREYETAMRDLSQDEVEE